MSPTDQDPQLRVAPFVRGVATREHAIVRRLDAPEYLSLTRLELAAVDEVVRVPTTVSDFLGRHLSGQQPLDFRAAVGLLLKLHQHGFIENTTDDMAARLREFSGRTSGQTSTRLRRLLTALTRLIDLPLLRFDRSQVHPLFRLVGRVVVSGPALVVYGGGLLARAVYAGMTLLPEPRFFAIPVEAPERLLVEAFFAFSLASSWLAFLQMAALAGLGAQFVGGSLRVTGLCVVRLAVDDRDAFCLSKGALARLQALSLMAPWLWASLCFAAADAKALNAPAALFGSAFALLGLFQLCPLYRGPLVKLGEGFLARLGVLERSNQ